ncbi:hypothetical protein D3C85_1089880 [compost metagenome]
MGGQFKLSAPAHRAHGQSVRLEPALPDGRTRGHLQQHVLGQVGGLAGRVAGRQFGADHGDDVLVHQPMWNQPRPVAVAHGDHGVDARQIQVKARHPRMQVDQDAWMARVEAVQPGHQPLRGEGGQRGQVEGAAAGAVRDRLQGRAADAVQGRRQFLLITHAGFGQQDAPLLAPEQRHFQQIFQCLDLPADGALG